MLYNDARRLSKGEGILARFALGWTGVIAIGTLALFFRIFFEDSAIAYPFWFYAGMIAASAVRVKKVERKKMAANIRAHMISEDTETTKVGA
jgi:uncharacterized membrane protein